MLLALTLLATVGLKIAHERADTLERMQAEKFLTVDVKDDLLLVCSGG
jgi:hypothetical protein